MKSKDIYLKWLEYAKNNQIKTSNNNGRDPEDTDLISFINTLGIPKNISNEVLSNFDFSTQNSKDKDKKTSKSPNVNDTKTQSTDTTDTTSIDVDNKVYSSMDIQYIDKVKNLIDGFNKKTMKKLLGFLNDD